MTREAMKARGPDGAGVWWSNCRRCGLGHRRLAILDLSERAAQPMISDDSRLAVTFNGEIYNYRQLRVDLEEIGTRFRTTSDTEILLHLYARYGRDMVHQIRGMFAFAIWDNSTRELFLARDPYGIKPLYTANDGWTFRFASQVKALLAGGAVSRDPEPAGIVGFHLFGSVPEPFTLFREIRALPAGHTQLVNSAGASTPKPYASLAAVLTEGARSPTSRSEVSMLVREATLNSVKAHLLADVEVGLFLSAGIDSGALLGLMRDAGQDKVRAVTLGFKEFEGTSEDEVPLASQVAMQYGARQFIRRVSEHEFKADLPLIIEAMDQPSVDGVNTWFVAKAAKEAGLKVALSGIGGDEMLAGYSTFHDIPRWRNRYGALASVPFLGSSIRPIAAATQAGFVRRHPKALGMLEYASSWEGAYLLRRGVFLPHELSAVVGKEIAREGMRRLRPLNRIAAALQPDPRNSVSRVCVLESVHYLKNQLLRDADWAGMAHSIEIRVPLVDWLLTQRLAPAIASLTPGLGKAALAMAPTRVLPTSIADRAKTGFSVPIEAWTSSLSARGAAANPSKGLGARDRCRSLMREFLPGLAHAA